MGKQQQQQVHKVVNYCVIFIFLTVTVDNVFSNAIGQKDQENFENNQGLYNSSDFVIVLNQTNFKSHVHNSKRTWLVEFYNSWCGFCQRFAPIWKSLAKSIHGWRHIISIAAIDCANDDNNPLCREYEVMKYPTLKFFPINSKPDFLGLEIQKDSDEILIRHALIDQLVKEQHEQRGSPTWPNIAPYWGTEISNLWHGTPNNVQYQFLIFEEPKSYLGAEVILDLHKLNNVRIRRITSENEFLCVTNKVTKFPSLIVLNKDNSQEYLKINPVTREGIRKTITEFLKLKGISVDITEDDSEEIKENFSFMSKPKNRNELREINNSEDKLYQLDLEYTLRYSLNNEIPLSSHISGEKLEALRAYLKALVNYFPTYSFKTRAYLQVLKEIVNSRNNITGKDFREQVRLKEKDLMPIYSGPKTWIGCKGSIPTLRGYPCGLWTMFHTLTVAAARDTDNELASVLRAIHGYVKNFFSCADCVEHFENMAKKRKLFNVNGGDESILWLWQAHNEVNKRLAGDPTEDPEYKKIQYPSTKNCPKCKLSSGEWDQMEVLRYLKMKYSRSNSNSQGISDSSTSSRKLGWDFTIFDISICVVLYIMSATILTLVCIKFAYRRTHKKKMSFQNLLGLV